MSLKEVSCKKCLFCGRLEKKRSLEYGPLYQVKNIVAHYFCVLLSSHLAQNGHDDQGILGFLVPDIIKELNQNSNSKCSYCKKTYATIKCCHAKCQLKFHLPCGLKHNSLHQFKGKFPSYCFSHRPYQKIPQSILKEVRDQKLVCPICLDSVNWRNKLNTFWAPCCLKTWYHKKCLQKLAESAGYFFKCSICNDKRIFRKTALNFGIFIPQRDASWELSQNAFEELLYRYQKCDTETCKCPFGRETNVKNSKWEIILCESCGSQGTHVACENLKDAKTKWNCSVCLGVYLNIASVRLKEKNVQAINDCSLRNKTLESSYKRKKRSRALDNSELSILNKNKRRRKASFCSKNECDINIRRICVEGSESDEGSENIIDVVTVDNSTSSTKAQSELKSKSPSSETKSIQKMTKPQTVTTTEKTKTRNQEVIEIDSSDSDSEVEVLYVNQKNSGNFLKNLDEKPDEGRFVITLSDDEKNSKAKKQIDNLEKWENFPEGSSLNNFEVVGSLRVVSPMKSSASIEVPITPSTIKIKAVHDKLMILQISSSMADSVFPLINK